MANTPSETNGKGISKGVIALVAVVVVGVIIGAIVLNTTSSATDAKGNNVNANANNQNVTTYNYTPPTNAATNQAAKTEDDKKRDEQYSGAVKEAIETNKLPNGQELTTNDDYNSEENMFAVADVDGDGIQELVVMWNQTGSDETVGSVLQYDLATGSWITELNAAPMMTFYTTGYCKVLSPVNNTSGSIFPYTMYKYDASSNSYSAAHTVYSWTKAMNPDGYPSDIDTNGVGTVFNVDGNWVSQATWSELEKEWMPSGSMILFDYYSMTFENAAKLVQ